MKKIIKLTESDLHKIVKESVNRILKEGYYEDMYLDDYDIECPFCDSNHVEPISEIDTHYRCLDCGEDFYLDNGWEPDWGAMRHESHKRNGKMLKEMDLNPRINMNAFDAHGHGFTSRSHTPNSPRRKAQRFGK